MDKRMASNCLSKMGKRDARMPERALIWVLSRGEGIENVSALRSGSKSELDASGGWEGMWTIVRNVKMHSIGEMTLTVTSPATATSKAWKVSGGAERMG